MGGGGAQEDSEGFRAARHPRDCRRPVGWHLTDGGCGVGRLSVLQARRGRRGAQGSHRLWVRRGGAGRGPVGGRPQTGGIEEGKGQESGRKDAWAELEIPRGRSCTDDQAERTATRPQRALDAARHRAPRWVILSPFPHTKPT